RGRADERDPVQRDAAPAPSRDAVGGRDAVSRCAGRARVSRVDPTEPRKGRGRCLRHARVRRGTADSRTRGPGKHGYGARAGSARGALREERMIDLKGTVAVVTGGSRGIGRAVVKQMTSAGAKVVFSYASELPSARSIVAEVES